MFRFTGNPHAQKGLLPWGRSSARRVVALLPFLALVVLVAVTALAFGMLAAGVGNVQAEPGSLTITATATGSLTPTPEPSAPCTNGDFEIPLAYPPCGDGSDDETTWTFDFTTVPGYAAFQACGQPLTSALLRLHLTPRNGLVTDDAVQTYKPGASNVQSLAMNSQIQALSLLPVGEFHDVVQELLVDVSSADILNVFQFSPVGQVPMIYRDDSIVSFAQLELTKECPAAAVGGEVELHTDADAPSAASGSGSSSDYTLLIAAAVAGAIVVLAASGWYARRRWLR